MVKGGLYSSSMKTNKKGLSDVITTVLIILLVLAAVAIIASFALPAIRKGASQINSDCLTQQLIPTVCKVTSTTTKNTDVTLKWVEGSNTKFSSVKLIFSDGTKEAVVDINDVSGLSFPISTTYTIAGANFSAFTGTPTGVYIRPSVKTQTGDSTLCSQTAVITCAP